MYLTAHKVIQRNTNKHGINCFLHRHGSSAHDWHGDVSSIPETDPGILVAENIEIPPGGNKVQSYLDILSSDATSERKLRGVLDRMLIDLGERRNPTIFRESGVTIRFGVEHALEGQRMGEFRVLTERAITLLQNSKAKNRAISGAG